ncbi:MAG TPA: Lrp/AsnC family transcriptional regulator [Alphaproteobacteria bacterium]|jgi:Lrp/AsnC family transcriptional regulator|nr:Lrp/AsnC family transcriptional regulator [Alphaproteobacteria bacterium]|tara:strand:+ start:263 stop:724 length:462 start_codon:yes stop_codon:yes gene_type:complete
MDDIDKKILSLLQDNATLPLSELSKRAGVSKTPCWNRIRKMEEEGVIESRVTVLDNKKINLNIVVFLSVSVSSHSKEWMSDFQKILTRYDQIIEAYRLTGSSTDYLLKIVAPSIAEYDNFQQQLINEVKFTKMSSSIALKEIKKIHSLPLDYI